MGINLKKLQLLFEQEDNITRASKEYCRREGITFDDSFRRKCSKLLNSVKSEEVDDDLENEVKPKKQKKEQVEIEDSEIFSMPSAWSSELNRFYSIEEYCNKFNLSYNSLERYNLVAHNAGHMVDNVRFKQTLKEVEGIDEDFIESIVKNHIHAIPITEPKPSNKDYFDRLVISDIHIGMSTEGGRNVTPLYDSEWNEYVLFERLQKTIQHVLEYKKGDMLVIDELGDYVDGLFGETTRKGHHLPQNMSDKKAFEVGVKFKMTLIEELLPYYSKIICNSIVEDNHSGVFGYFVNSTVKHIIEGKYSNVEYNVLERFINHYSIGKHTFIESHGKDSESLKFGFKPILDNKQADKIDQYCKEHNLYNGNFIEFAKGDSHQFIFDFSTSRDFHYCNYPAFSPPSNWVLSNFGKSMSGFVFQNVDKNKNIKIQIPFYF